VETDLSRLIGQVNELQGLLAAFLEIFHKLGSCVYSLMLQPLQSGVWCRFAVYGTTRGRRRSVRLSRCGGNAKIAAGCHRLCRTGPVEAGLGKLFCVVFWPVSGAPFRRA
jgi:hypothetical protein